MLSLIVAMALVQTQVDTQKCSLVGKQLDVHVVLENSAGRTLFNIHCDGQCSGAYLRLGKTEAEPRKVSFVDLGSMGSLLRVQSMKGSMVVLEHGVNQFTIDLKEGRVLRTAKGERAEGRCVPIFYP